MTYKDNTPTFNTNSGVRNFKDFCADAESLAKTRRGFRKNSQIQNYLTNTRNEYNPVTHKITALGEEEVLDRLDALEDLEGEGAE